MSKKLGSNWPIFIVAILVIGLFSFYLVYRTSYDNKKDDTVNKDTDDKVIEKLDSNKNYVYSKAEYKLTDLGDIDTIQDWMKETIFWIKTPVINLNSDDVTEINNRIESNAKSYKDSITYADLYGDQKRYITHFTTYDYTYYINGDIISLMLVKQEYIIPSSGVPKGYEVYNVNTKTGELLTNNDLMTIKQTNANNVITKIENVLHNDEINNCPASQDNPPETNCYNDIMINSDTEMYLNNDNKLVIIVPITEAGFENNIINEHVTID